LKLKATILVKRSNLWATEQVGEFEYTPETYRMKIEKLRELLRSANLE